MNLYVTQKLRHRPLVYPVLFILAALVTWFMVKTENFTSIRPQYTWERESRTMGERKSLNIQLPHSTENEVISNHPEGDYLLNAVAPEIREFATGHEPDNSNDAWGNPYHIVFRREDAGTWIGLYSTGEDGGSASQGNDPDDINSWGQDGFPHYIEIIRQLHQQRSIKQAAVRFPIVFTLLILLYEYKRRHLPYPAGLCQHCGYDLRGNANAICSECGHVP